MFVSSSRAARNRVAIRLVLFFMQDILRWLIRALYTLAAPQGKGIISLPAFLSLRRGPGGKIQLLFRKNLLY